MHACSDTQQINMSVVVQYSPVSVSLLVVSVHNNIIQCHVCMHCQTQAGHVHNVGVLTFTSADAKVHS